MIIYQYQAEDLFEEKDKKGFPGDLLDEVVVRSWK